MKIKKPVTLRSRLSIFNAVFLSATFLIGLVLVYFVLRTWLYHQIDNSLIEMADQVSTDIVVDKNTIIYQEEKPSISLENQRQFMRIIDRRGQVKEHFGPLKEVPVKVGFVGYSTKGSFQELFINNDDEPIRIYTLPIISHDKSAGFIQVGQSLDPIENMLQMLIATMILLAPLFFALTLLASRLITGRALAPITNIAATAEIISERELHRRLNIPGEDEVARLARSLNRMLDRLEQAVEGYKQFTGDASHELRTPLTVMKGEISLALQKKRDVSYYKEVLVGIEEEVDRLIRMVEQLLFLARADGDKIKKHFTKVDLQEILVPLLEQMSVAANAKHQELTWEIPRNVFVTTDSDAFQQIMVNLVDNAVKYTPEYGKIKVGLEMHQELIKISVADSGNGIPNQHLERIFERFYRVDKGRSRELGGTGLGLAIVEKLTHLIGGRLKVSSVVGHGTAFTLEFSLRRNGSEDQDED